MESRPKGSRECLWGEAMKLGKNRSIYFSYKRSDVHSPALQDYEYALSWTISAFKKKEVNL